MTPYLTILAYIVATAITIVLTGLAAMAVALAYNVIRDIYSYWKS